MSPKISLIDLRLTLWIESMDWVHGLSLSFEKEMKEKNDRWKIWNSPEFKRNIKNLKNHAKNDEILVKR